MTLQSAILESLGDPIKLLTTNRNLSTDKVTAISLICSKLAGRCRLNYFDQGPLDLTNEGLVVFEPLENCSSDLVRVIRSSIGGRRDDTGFSQVKTAYTTTNYGFMHFGRTRDTYFRPVMSITGDSSIGLLYITRLLFDSDWPHVSVPSTFDYYPVEIKVCPAPYVTEFRSRLGLNHLNVEIVCGPLEYDFQDRKWIRRPVAQETCIHRVEGSVSLIMVNGIEYHRGISAKFNLLVHIAINSGRGSWSSISKAVQIINTSKRSTIKRPTNLVSLSNRLNELIKEGVDIESKLDSNNEELFMLAGTVREINI